MIVCWTQSARSWNTVSMPASRERAAFQCVSALAAHQDFAAGRLDRAGEHLDQRRFAGAVVAKQAHDLAAVDVEIDAADREHASVALGDVPEFDQPFAHRRVSEEREGPARRDRRAEICQDGHRSPSIARSATAL